MMVITTGFTLYLNQSFVVTLSYVLHCHNNIIIMKHFVLTSLVVVVALCTCLRTVVCVDH